MSIRMRLVGAIGLLILALLAVVFLGSDVTSCLGPLGRTYVESIADGCIKPGIGSAVPIGIALVLGALLLLEPSSRRPVAFRLRIAATAAIVAVLAYLVARPTSITGPTSSGEVITVQLPIDLAMIGIAVLGGGGLGWFASRWTGAREAATLR